MGLVYSMVYSVDSKYLADGEGPWGPLPELFFSLVDLLVTIAILLTVTTIKMVSRLVIKVYVSRRELK